MGLPLQQGSASPGDGSPWRSRAVRAAGELIPADHRIPELIAGGPRPSSLEGDLSRTLRCSCSGLVPGLLFMAHGLQELMPARLSPPLLAAAGPQALASAYERMGGSGW
jgi:hypothetical protein